jgi:hypothetical protein
MYFNGIISRKIFVMVPAVGTGTGIAFIVSLGTARYFYKFSTYRSLFLQLDIPTLQFLFVFCLFLEFFCWLVLGTLLSLI